jgi:hypothetical protein
MLVFWSTITAIGDQVDRYTSNGPLPNIPTTLLYCNQQVHFPIHQAIYHQLSRHQLRRRGSRQALSSFRDYLLWLIKSYRVPLSLCRHLRNTLMLFKVQFWSGNMTCGPQQTALADRNQPSSDARTVLGPLHLAGRVFFAITATFHSTMSNDGTAIILHELTWQSLD